MLRTLGFRSSNGHTLQEGLGFRYPPLGFNVESQCQALTSKCTASCSSTWPNPLSPQPRRFACSTPVATATDTVTFIGLCDSVTNYRMLNLKNIGHQTDSFTHIRVKVNPQAGCQHLSDAPRCRRPRPSETWNVCPASTKWGTSVDSQCRKTYTTKKTLGDVRHV